LNSVKTVSKEIPIPILGDVGVRFENLQKAISSASAGICTRVPSMVDAFQIVINKGRGVMFIRMEDKQTLSEFAKTFQIAIRQLNISQIKILIFSNQNEIITSRALTQFPFVRTMTPVNDVKRLTTILVTECLAIQSKADNKKPKNNGLSSGFVVIKGDRPTGNLNPPIIQERDLNKGHKIIQGKIADPETKSDWLPVPDLNNLDSAKPKKVNMEKLKSPPWQETQNIEDKEKLLNQCIGPHVPTFIYNEELSWRVRGFYSTFDSKENTVTFVVSHAAGAEKIKEEIQKSNTQFLSSTSTPKARVCSSISYIKEQDLEFTFRTPDSVQGIQRRSNQRAKMTADMPVLVQYFDDRLGADRTLNVLDLSVSGLGLRLDKDFIGDFEVGRHIGNLNLFVFNRVIRIPDAEVRHCSKSDLDPSFKILGLLTTGLTQTDINFLEMFVLSQHVDEAFPQNT